MNSHFEIHQIFKILLSLNRNIQNQIDISRTNRKNTANDQLTVYEMKFLNLFFHPIHGFLLLSASNPTHTHKNHEFKNLWTINKQEKKKKLKLQHFSFLFLFSLSFPGNQTESNIKNSKTGNKSRTLVKSNFIFSRSNLSSSSSKIKPEPPQLQSKP